MGSKILIAALQIATAIVAFFYLDDVLYYSERSLTSEISSGGIATLGCLVLVLAAVLVFFRFLPGLYTGLAGAALVSVNFVQLANFLLRLRTWRSSYGLEEPVSLFLLVGLTLCSLLLLALEHLKLQASEVRQI